VEGRRSAGSVGRADQEYPYDVCLSFAGEERTYVERVAKRLVVQGVRVFYDEYEQVELWGKDLYAHLDDMYRNSARYCVIFASKAYASKLWSNHERRSAQARAFSENREYILPARFDSTEIPGLLPTIGYVNLRKTSPSRLADMIVEKLGARQRNDFLPPQPNRLYQRLGIKTIKQKEIVFGQAQVFVEALGHMNADERMVILAALRHGCPTELPKNIHIAIDLLHRVTGFPPHKIKRICGRLRSLGFVSRVRRNPQLGDQHLGEMPLVVIEYHNLTDVPREFSTDVAYEMVHGAVENLCDQCGEAVIMRADFSQLSSATSEKERH
jgi:predicted RNA-binding Zn-ribbon protein involved in translation (DUF1610 family)